MKDNRLSKEAVRSALTTTWLGQEILYLPAVPSTNDHLKELAKQGAPAGTMVVTDYQTAGKGRLNRRWEAPASSSLLVSLLFRPDWPPQQAIWLTMMAGLAAVSAVQQETGLTPALKWPNDLVIQVDGEWRKFGGLLLEGQFETDHLSYAILGSGLNVNLQPGDLPDAQTPATSLSAVLGKHLARLPLLNRYLLELERLYETAEAGLSPQPAWANCLITIGQQIRVNGQNLETAIDGTAEGVDTWGRLLVRQNNGRLHTLAAGDVTLRG